MTETVFDRETILDLMVNVIPFGILLIFFVVYLVFSPFGFDSVISSIQLGIIGVSAVGLAVLSYYSGKAVSRAEKAEEKDLESAEALSEDTAEGRA